MTSQRSVSRSFLLLSTMTSSRATSTSQQRGESFQPSGVFDLFEAYIADPEEDLVRMLWEVDTDDQRRAFIDGYADSKPLRDGAADRLELYALADWLVIWGYGKSNGVWFNDVTFTESFRPILARARSAAAR